MWELDLEYLAMNQADTMDTQADADVPQIIAFSHSEKMVATISEQSHIEFLDSTTGEVVSRTDIDKQTYDGMRIAFSPNEYQIVLYSRSLITVCSIMHPDNRVSFNPWPRQDIRIRKVAFQTCNDLVICASDDDSALLQVWHWQDPAGFECTYSSEIEIEDSRPYLAPDGLTVVIIPLPNVIHGIVTLPNFILSSLLTIQWIFTSLNTHPMGDSLHAGLGMTLTSESGTHEPANSFPSSECPGWMQWPSHLL